MTKSILLFATCGLIFASCSKTDADDSDLTPPVDLNTISFTATTTRAAINDLTALQHPTTGGFHVYGTNNSVAGWHTDVDGKEYKFNPTTSIWEWAATTAQWPTDPTHFPMSFYAHHPKTANGFTAVATAPVAPAGVSSLKGEIVIEPTGADQVDFLAAINTTITKPPTAKLAMVFSHITSKINFGVITGVGVTAYVNKVDINTLVDAGTYDYGTKTWDFTGSAGTANYDYFDGSGTTDDFFNTATTLNLKSPIYGTAAHSSHLMLIPQNATPVWDGTASGVDAEGNATGVTGAYIGMLYRIETTTPLDVDAVGYKVRDNNLTETVWAPGAEFDSYNVTNGSYNGPLYVKVGFPIGTNPLSWLKGKGYTYNMKLGTTDATGGLYLSKYYYDEDGNNTKIPVKGDPEITDPVASGDIHFDVDIDAWEDEPDTDL